jgi:exodeoxyribonuclease VII small subunit
MPKSTQPEISYTEAMSRIEEILEELENEETDIDQLSQRVKEAGELIALCKQKLKNTAQEVEERLEKLDDSE